MRALVLVVTMLAVACQDGPNTQYLPIGSPCFKQSDCGTQPFDCALDVPGGSCVKSCSDNTDCPTDSACARKFCKRSCHSSAGCRAPVGYGCWDEGATTMVCDFVPDGGLP
jgi:hypothetical protein